MALVLCRWPGPLPRKSSPVKIKFRFAYLPLPSCLFILLPSARFSSVLLWSRGMAYSRSIALESWKLLFNIDDFFLAARTAPDDLASPSLSRYSYDLATWLHLLCLLLRSSQIWLIRASLSYFQCPSEMTVSLRSSLISGTTWCLRLVFYLLCHWARSGIGHFPKKLWYLSVGIGIGDQNLGAWSFISTGRFSWPYATRKIEWLFSCINQKNIRDVLVNDKSKLWGNIILFWKEV